MCSPFPDNLQKMCLLEPTFSVFSGSTLEPEAKVKKKKQNEQVLESCLHIPYAEDVNGLTQLPHSFVVTKSVPTFSFLKVLVQFIVDY